MPAVPSTPRVKLRTTSRRVPRTRAKTDEPEVETEPNMRLSRAIVVMLLLHVVAVGGILAFSLIKEHNADSAGSHRGGAGSGSALEAEDSMLTPLKPAAPQAETPPPPKGSTVHVVQPGETLLRIANDNGVTVEALISANGAKTAMSSLRPGQELRLPEKSPEPGSMPPDGTSGAPARNEERTPTANSAASPAKTHLPADSGKTYVVGKGESPYAIAQKLKVSQESLLKLNRIDDPKKLKPGQKLHVPVASGNKI